MSGTFNFEYLFEKTKNQKISSEEQNFFSRLFGLFYEKIVPIWCNINKEYEYIEGRPSLYNLKNQYLHRTYDFVFKKNEKLFLVEQKNWIAYENFKFLEINKNNLKKIKHHLDKDEELNKFCSDPKNYIVKVNQEKKEIQGVIFIWPRVSINDLEYCKKELKVYDILSFEEMIKEIKHEKAFIGLIEKYQNWCNDFFDRLKK